jgi:hypothetical protein
MKDNKENDKQCAIQNVSTSEKPTMEKYGWHTQCGFDDDPSGWMFEGGEEAYEEAINKWEKENPHLC